MENTERVLAMQRQRRHIHENKRKDLEGSDRSVGMRAFRQQQDSRTHMQRWQRAHNMSGGNGLFPVHGDHPIVTAMFRSTAAPPGEAESRTVPGTARLPSRVVRRGCPNTASENPAAEHPETPETGRSFRPPRGGDNA